LRAITFYFYNKLFLFGQKKPVFIKNMAPLPEFILSRFFHPSIFLNRFTGKSVVCGGFESPANTFFGTTGSRT